MKNVKYSQSDSSSNKILRVALLRVWGYSCYMCGKDLEAWEAQIDHIIPKSLYNGGEKGRAELADIKNLLEGNSFSIVEDGDALENLAPVCPKCNREKGDKVQLCPLLRLKLEKAKKYADEILKSVKNVKLLRKIDEVMAAFGDLDYDDPNVKDNVTFYFSAIKHVMEEAYPNDVELFEEVQNLDMPIYGKVDHCGHFPGKYHLGDRKFGIKNDPTLKNELIIFLHKYGLRINEFSDVLISEIEKKLEDDITEKIFSYIESKAISLMSPEFLTGLGLDFRTSITSFGIESESPKIEGNLIGDGGVHVFIPDYPEDEGKSQVYLRFYFEYDFDVKMKEGSDGERYIPRRIDEDTFEKYAEFPNMDILITLEKFEADYEYS